MESLRAETVGLTEPVGETRGWSRAVVLVVVVFVALAALVSVATPPWEANDEPDHLRNVNALVGGEMYRIGPSGGLESHQPPLYYLALAGLQRALGIGVRNTYPAYNPVGGPALGNFDHHGVDDGVNQRYVTLMRLTGIALGAAVVLVTFAVARRLSADRWTPVLAAGLVATQPKFVFLSAVVNNDNLANLLGALVILGSIRALQDQRGGHSTGMSRVVLLGGLVGLAVATKLTCVALALPVLLVAWRASSDLRRRLALVVSAMSATALPVLPWVVFNLREYDEPLASKVSGEYFDAVIPGLMRKSVDASVYFREIPEGFWKTFWYSSGWNQFEWAWWAYVPFWALLIPAGILGVHHLRRSDEGRAASCVLGAAAGSAIAVYVYIATITTGTQARVTFVALPAIASVVALGSERWRWQIRWLLPVLGIVGTLIAFRDDVLRVYFLGA